MSALMLWEGVVSRELGDCASRVRRHEATDCVRVVEGVLEKARLDAMSDSRIDGHSVDAPACVYVKGRVRIT